MSTVADVLKSLPGIVPEDAYDDGYPDGAAGHVLADGRIDTSEDAVRTPFGVDHAFTGEHIDRDPGRRNEQVGEEATNRLIAEVVAAVKRDHRQAVDQSADDAVYGNVTLADAKPIRLVYANRKRASLCVVNQSATAITVYVGNASGILAGGPNTALLAQGQGRTFYHRQEVWIVGSAGAVVDFVEENYR